MSTARLLHARMEMAWRGVKKGAGTLKEEIRDAVMRSVEGK